MQPECEPLGHGASEGAGKQAGPLPPQQGVTQYCEALQLAVPQGIGLPTSPPVFAPLVPAWATLPPEPLPPAWLTLPLAPAAPLRLPRCLRLPLGPALAPADPRRTGCVPERSSEVSAP